MKKVAILQSNYIPWKGYFDLIAAVDEFIIFDDMQYTRRDWRNRNQIKTPQGAVWLTVPVKVKGKYHQTIRDTEIGGAEWAASHWKALALNYKKAPHFNEVAAILEPLYLGSKHEFLSPLNRELIESICRYLGITTRITNSWDYHLVDGRTERLAELCTQAQATEYVSGPAAKEYIDESVFNGRNVKLTWFDYTGYHEYPQLWGSFTHFVSIVDLLFNCGNEAPRYMRHVRK
ncbi:WbqC family protein [Rhizobium sp. 57MFTsu3.2]|uniref:WbqC family protein n=1 Tax=Rhizobium sp. 57MFTsu3.2 TaxID=1048681 RepID=UPI00146BCF00|nr:WbqC family protein [Rhizobium sp. 57MFTsu3.2]NMN73801.1 WbqC-like protein [Rhizobium sp. 57MFTsu3.2]